MMMDDGLQIDDAHGDGSEVDDVITPPPHPNPTPPPKPAP